MLRLAVRRAATPVVRRVAARLDGVAAKLDATRHRPTRFAEGVRKEALAWEARLAHLSETLDEWVACQRGWMYLVDASPPRP